MPPHLIEKQKMAINGFFNYDATVFIQQARQGWHLIVLGLYPIANDCEGKIFYVPICMLHIVKDGN
jgi:hypothetical protein